MRISNQRALKIITDVPESHPTTNDNPRSWMPLAAFCGMTIGSSILFVPIEVIFLKNDAWISCVSSDGFIHLLQMMSSRESHDFSHGMDRLDFRKRPSGETIFLVL